MRHALAEDACPCDDEIAAFLRGGLPSEATSVVEAHIARCDLCRRLLSAFAQLSDRESDRIADSVSPTLPVSANTMGSDLSFGTRFGRYVVLDWLGTGGMGVVYAAYDSELNRKVALKVLGDDGAGSGDRTPHRELLLREAQAMAQLAHPNVVTVYDVGSFADRVFIAMELVEGMTLARWLVAEPRARSEILAMFVAAGNGLAAAHAAGLIHRDFKPDNVLIGKDGRVRVTDFGLARAMAPEPFEPGSRGEVGPGCGGSGARSAVVGTLAYMAPEQYLGRPVDPRADQFSFAVALYEALHGRRPATLRPGSTGEQASGELVVVPRRSGIPMGLRHALLRALRTDPAGRYPSMAELLAALAPRPWRSRMVGVSVVAAAVVVAGAYAIHLRGAAEQRTELVGRLRELAPELRAQLRSAHLLPRHDIRPARDEIRRTLREVERQRNTRAGQDERTLIDFVLGEGYLALGDYKRAVDSLETAWAGGERGPRIDAALGDALAVSYERRLDELEETVKKVDRTAEVHALEVRYRDPAMVHLRAARTARASSPGYLDASIAFHEHRFADSVRIAGAVFSGSPMLYEAGVLEAKAHHQIGRALLSGDKRAEANQEFARAQQVFERVLEIARSDDEAWRGYGEMLLAQAAALSDSDLPPALRDQALTAFQNARQINPDNWEAALSEAAIHENQGNLAIVSSRDPSAYVERVLALASEARALGASADRIDPIVCLAHWQRGVYRGAHGIDPDDEFAQALAACELAATARPTADRYDELGVVYLSIASNLGRHGKDPTQSFARSERSFRAALDVEDDPLFHLSLGRMSTKLALYRACHGQDPQGAVDRAVAEYELAAGRDATRLTAWTGISDALAAGAEFQQQRHEDPRPTLLRARAALDRISQKTYVPATTSRMTIAILEAEALLDRGADPTQAVGQIRDGAQQLLRHLPDDEFAHRCAALAELIAARWATVHREAVDVARATSEAARAVSIDPTDALGWTIRAEVEQLRAATSHGPDADAAIEQGVSFIERAIAIDPRLVRALRVRDALTRLAELRSRLRGSPGAGTP